MQPGLDDIKVLVDALAEKIEAPKSLLPAYGKTIDAGSASI